MHATVSAGLVLGLLTGGLVGLSTSPVAGVAVTGLIAVAASVLNVGADTEELLKARWRYFQPYALAFAVAFGFFALVGLGIRTMLPVPSDAMVAELRTLKVPEAEIAKFVVAAAGNVDFPAAFFGTGFFYGEGRTESAGLDRRRAECGRRGVLSEIGYSSLDPAIDRRIGREQSGRSQGCCGA